jgi:hypothetical protein
MEILNTVPAIVIILNFGLCRRASSSLIAPFLPFLSHTKSKSSSILEAGTISIISKSEFSIRSDAMTRTRSCVAFRPLLCFSTLKTKENVSIVVYKDKLPVKEKLLLYHGCICRQVCMRMPSFQDLGYKRQNQKLCILRYMDSQNCYHII